MRKYLVAITKYKYAKRIGTATFSVKGAGSGTLSYKWNVYDHLESRWITPNPAYYSGVDTASLTRYNVTINDHTDQFRCVVSNEGGSVTSGAATLTVSTTDGGGNNYGGSSSGGGGCEVGFSFGFAVMALGLATLKGRKKH